MSKVDPIVSVSWLSGHIRNPSSKVIILDSSFDIFDHHGNHSQYVSGHIPGALFFDLNKCVKPQPTCPRNLPDQEAFGEYARSLGICRDSHLVVYDRNDIYSSTKAWWIFKAFGHSQVSVLDGGMMEWQGQGHELAQGDEAASQPGDFEIRVDKSLMVEFDEMSTIVRDKKTQIVDTRLKEHFTGEEEEPSLLTNLGFESVDLPKPPIMHRGHVLGAVNIVYNTVLQGEGSFRFLSKDGLLKLFADSGVDLSKPMVTTCYLGHSATIVNIAACICGYDAGRLYYPSWAEFGQIGQPDLVIGTPKP